MYMTKKKKSVLAKMIVMLMTVLTMALAINCTMTVSASAVAEIPEVEVIADAGEMSAVITDTDFITLEVTPVANVGMIAPKIHKLDGEVAVPQDADSTYQTVINFFITWLRRIGALVALVGAIMFALAIKNNDAEQKQNGLMTLVAGFVAVAVCTAADMFDLFS